MFDHSLLPEELKTYQYYQDQVPLYLKNSPEFMGILKVFCDLIIEQEGYCRDDYIIGNDVLLTTSNDIVKNLDLLLQMMNVFDKGCEDPSHQFATECYIRFLNNIDGSLGGTRSDILDKLGNLFGLKREFSIEYLLNDVQVKEYLRLNNHDFLTLIKCTIIKNYFDGSYKMLHDLYEDVGLPIFILTSGPAFCEVYLLNFAESAGMTSADVQRMFLAGMLTINSLGIEYSYTIQNYANLMIFDSSDAGAVIGTGAFVI